MNPIKEAAEATMSLGFGRQILLAEEVGRPGKEADKAGQDDGVRQCSAGGFYSPLPVGKVCSRLPAASRKKTKRKAAAKKKETQLEVADEQA